MTTETERRVDALTPWPTFFQKPVRVRATHSCVTVTRRRQRSVTAYPGAEVPARETIG